jgi:hypothetical protein
VRNSLPRSDTHLPFRVVNRSECDDVLKMVTHDPMKGWAFALLLL